MKKVLIASFDMEVGGVERSLISLLESFDYTKYNINLMLYRHQGEFMSMLPKEVNLVKEVAEYATFRRPISEIVKNKQYGIAVARILAKYIGLIAAKAKGFKELGLIPMQLGWKYTMPFLPKLDKEYDVAISYLWPHYFIADKVKGKKKIAWIHTDYSYLEIDNKMDYKMWDKFDWIVAVSEDCKRSFLSRYPQFSNKTIVVENITAVNFIKSMAEKDCSAEIRVDDKCTKLITVARLAYAKGIDDAVRACRKLVDDGYDIRWYVVGYGSEETAVRKLIEELKLEDRFIILGKKLNPYPYIRACDIYVQPSRYEGKAVTVTEAQVLEKPVLITRYSTANSQVRHEYDGIITDLGVEGLVLGVKKLLDNPELQIRLKKNTAKVNYNNSFEIEKLYKLLG
ncbi:glycosyltransferase [Clostridium thermarum]|uniref:glycosyltransferase n=1 Tax=Clostridium thermarum TaxID=1716543 RepID=UPI00111DDA2E|nr:glycosyltransferase [Clostridium thermarum]